MRNSADLVSVEEYYLSTGYSPDCDYVDGVLEDRNVGRSKHARAQTQIAVFLCRLRKWLVIHVLIAQTVRVSATRFRVPDVCATIGEPDQEIFTTAPFLCVEVLSPDDRASRMQEKIADCIRMGMRYVWVVDPYACKARIRARTLWKPLMAYCGPRIPVSRWRSRRYRND